MTSSISEQHPSTTASSENATELRKLSLRLILPQLSITTNAFSTTEIHVQRLYLIVQYAGPTALIPLEKKWPHEVKARMTARKREASNKPGHPYLAGNFAPIQKEQQLTPCTYSGFIPDELVGGEYVRNGGNPVANEALGRDAHWFDGDGMLNGVSFRRFGDKGRVQPEFVNQYILTDVYLSSKTSSSLRTPILPSIATLVNPMSSLLKITLRILRTIFLVILSHLPGSQQVIKKISVANTAILYHDGRALATCESGPPLQIKLPGLETVGWFNGNTSDSQNPPDDRVGFGGTGLLSFMKEWTTAHPRVDPNTEELILYHSTFVPPYVKYSIIPKRCDSLSRPNFPNLTPILNNAVPGLSSGKMMHDFGVSSRYTIIMDLPLSLDPLNLAKNMPVVAYDPTGRSRFGIFPRYQPEDIRWFETNACCIFHTANSWDSKEFKNEKGATETKMVNMLACRLTSASLVFSAGDLAAPTPIKDIAPEEREEEQCRLYHYQFCLSKSTEQNLITHQWALSAVPFEFPTLRHSASMSAARYVYGCSVAGASFGAALGRAVKIDSLVKMDVETLIEKGKQNPPMAVKGCVDMRTVQEVLASEDPYDPIKIFKMPRGWYAQESRFVPRHNGSSEDDGWILSYVFDESQLDDCGECGPRAKSELWIIDARNMTDVVARIFLPQRVPYGLHGAWFSEADVLNQRQVKKTRSFPKVQVESNTQPLTHAWRLWMSVRRAIEAHLE